MALYHYFGIRIVLESNFEAVVSDCLWTEQNKLPLRGILKVLCMVFFWFEMGFGAANLFQAIETKVDVVFSLILKRDL